MLFINTDQRYRRQSKHAHAEPFPLAVVRTFEVET